MSNTYTEEQISDFLFFYKEFNSLKLIVENLRHAIAELHKIVPNLEKLKHYLMTSSLINLSSYSYLHKFISQQFEGMEKEYAVLYEAMARLVETTKHE